MISAEDREEVNMALRWLRDMHIELDEGEYRGIIGSRNVIHLDKLQRYMLIKLMWKSSLFDSNEK
jgi:hypothetical protein